MINLKYFIEKCPNFPIISPEEITLVQSDLQTEFRKLQALKRLPERYRSIEDDIALLNHNFIEAFLKLKAVKKINLFFADELQGAIQTLHLLWYETIKHYLSIPGTTSTQYLIHFHSLFADPPSFSALIICLLEQGIEPQRIIDEQILHRYFYYKVVAIEELQQTFDLLKSHEVSLTKVGELLGLAQTTHCGLETFPNTNLLGENHCQALTRSYAEATEFVLCTEVQSLVRPLFENFIHLFDLEFIFQALTPGTFDKEYQLKSVIQTWLGDLSGEETNALFTTILQKYHSSLQFDLFKNLCPLLTPLQAKELFAKSELFWIILATAPSIFMVYTKKSLREVCLKQVVSVKDIEYIAFLCQNKKFAQHHDYFYKKIFDLHLTHQELLHDSELCDRLFHHPLRNTWVSHAFPILLKNLNRTILSQIDDFNSENFITIRDYYYAQRYQVEFLCSQGGHLCDYPFDFYSFTSLIIQQLLNHKSDVNLYSALNAIVPHQYEESSAKQEMMERIAIEFFKKNQNPKYLLKVLCCLKENFAYTSEKILSFSAREGIVLESLALSHHEQFKMFLHLLPDCTWLQFLSRRQSADSELNMTRILKSPALLLVLIQEANPEWLMLFLEQVNKKNELIWFSLGLDSLIYQTLFDKLNLEHKIQLLSLRSSLNQNILHITVSKPEILHILLQNTPYHLRFFLYQQKDLSLESPLTLSLNHPDSFAYFLEKLPHHLHRNILLEHQRDGKNTFQIAMKKPELLKTMILCIQEDTLSTLLNLHFAELIEFYASRHDMLSRIFSCLESEYLLELISENDYYGLNRILSYPDSCYVLIEAIDPAVRYQCLSLVTESFYGKSLFYQLLSQRHCRLDTLLGFLNNDILFELICEDEVFELILQNEEILKQIFNRFSPSYQRLFSLIRNSKMETWHDLITLNRTQSLQLFLPIISYPSELLQQNIIYRAINHPQSLCVLLNLLPIEDRLPFIKSKIPPLFFQLKEGATVQATLKLLPEDEQLIFLQEKHQHKNNLLGFILSQTQHLSLLINFLSPVNLFNFCRKIINHHLPTTAFFNHQQSLITVLKNLPGLTAIQFLQEVCEQHHDKPFTTLNRLFLLKFIASNGEIISSNLSCFTSIEKKHPLYRAENIGECLPFLSQLSEQKRLLPSSPKMSRIA